MTTKEFSEKNAFAIYCTGVGDILASLNAFQQLGLEKNKIIDVTVDYKRFDRLSELYSLFYLPNINIELQVEGKEYTPSSAWGADAKWVEDWLRGWGCEDNKAMMKPKNEYKYGVDGRIGFSYTIGDYAREVRELSESTKINSIEFTAQTKTPIYYGHRKNNDLWVANIKCNLIFTPYNLTETVKDIIKVNRYIGADSGIAWIAAFHKIPTVIVLRDDYNSQSFVEIPHVKVCFESDFNNNYGKYCLGA